MIVYTNRMKVANNGRQVNVMIRIYVNLQKLKIVYSCTVIYYLYMYGHITMKRWYAVTRVQNKMKRI